MAMGGIFLFGILILAAVVVVGAVLLINRK